MQFVEVLGYFAFFSCAQYHIDARYAGDLFGFELCVTTGYDNDGLGVLAGNTAYGLPAFFVGEFRYRAGVDDADVDGFPVSGTTYAPLFEHASDGRSFGEVEFAP